MAEQATRIYAVRNRQDNSVRLVNAGNAARAIRHCALQTFEASVAKPKDLAHLIVDKGVQIETAGDEPIQGAE